MTSPAKIWGSLEKGRAIFRERSTTGGLLRLKVEETAENVF